MTYLARVPGLPLCALGLLVTGAAVTGISVRGADALALRPPAVPLVACDPYFSIWSPADKLTDADTVHWTGKPHRITSLARIDGVPYRVLGAGPEDVAAMQQDGLQVLPTRTIATFQAAGVALTLSFLTPALPEDLDLLARPVTYVDYAFRSLDGDAHDIELYLDAGAELTVNIPDQPIQASRESHGDLRSLKIGSIDQAVLAKKGDDIRIDWGYLYLAARQADRPRMAFAERESLLRGFAEHGPAGLDGLSAGLPAAAGSLAAGVSMELGTVADQPVSRWLLLAYDDLYSIQYMQHNLRPYWRRNGWEAGDLLRASARDYAALRERCEAFDHELMEDLTAAGGEKYAAISALAYRQCFAAGKFVADDNGQPLQFCKENHSNGCIGTSDVFYPMAPQFLLFGPTTAKSFLVPFMNYAASDRWRFPFAPHDLGQYPHANGQRYGGGERSAQNQMPVEESGNLLLLMTAIALMEDNADFAGGYWVQLEQWAEYLKDKGFDPENQLCTDDFAGHLAHNVNLSAKAICALGGFARLCALRGDSAKAAEYRRVAEQFAARWVKEADDGDHFRLAFDRSGTWSQKYNLVWDRILGLDLFPREVLQTEMAHYRRVQNRYGLPLDNRETYTKLDWVLWTATLTQDREDFQALVDPVFAFLNETPDRYPMTDWYFTKDARRRGFTARPVVGGVFLQMLYDREVWNKYASRDRTDAGGWAAMPRPPKTVTLVPTSENEGQMWRSTNQRPAARWFREDFNDDRWQESPGGFGTEGTPGAVVRTPWNTQEIWLRRSFSLAQPLPERVALRLHHDEDVQVYLNGVSVLKRRGYTTDYEIAEIDAGILRAGQNQLAIHCRQSTGGQYIDAGLDALVVDKPDP
jgi:hypothetical protein